MEYSEKAAIYRLHADFCKTLSDANRLLIINELSNGEVSVNELARKLELRQSNVSKHLAVMRERGLVTTRREGSTIYYSLSDARISKAIGLLREVQTDQFEKQRLLAHGVREFATGK
ncbi:MAG: helix-turn-helix transcriptional regulator [Dehalococcoidales bacterium]|nr:helix-turn-helix transcriptional regulator [Dehalococcoidales bacterium]